MEHCLTILIAVYRLRVTRKLWGRQLGAIVMNNVIMVFTGSPDQPGIQLHNGVHSASYGKKC